jgi:hypothetical protein
MITPQLTAGGIVWCDDQLPRLKEPFLSPLKDKESLAPQPPAFGQSSLAPLPSTGIVGLIEAPKATAQVSTPRRCSSTPLRPQ